MSQSINVSDLSGEAVAYLIQAGILSLDGVPTNGSTPAPAPAPEKEAKAKAQTPGWTNAVGYHCSSEWTASTSSRAIRNHLAGSCKCKKLAKDPKAEPCNWAARGRLTPEQFGTRPDILGIERLANENLVVFVGEGGVRITDVTL